MAGGKLSPRQKMINLMYLVFIAMLAMNMSKQVLSAFGYMNEKLESANTVAVQNGEKIYSGLKMKAAEQPEKFGAKNKKAQKIQAVSAEVYAHVEKMKKDLLKPIENPKDYESMDSDTYGNVYFFNGEKNTKNADAFVAELAKLRKVYADVLGNEYPGVVASVNARFETNDVTIGKKGKQSWIRNRYAGFPLVTTITNLSQIQADIKQSEKDMLTKMVQEQLESDVSMKNYHAILIPNTPATLQGANFKGKVVLGKYDGSLIPHSVVVNGKKITDIKDGGAILDFPAGNVGENEVNGEFVFMEDGKPVKIEIKSTYFVVAKPNSAVISADKMNLVYRGVANPMTISVPGVADNAVKASAAGLKKTKGVGKYMMNPGKGKEVKITVNAKLPDGTPISSSQKFRIKDIPAPGASIRGKVGMIKMPKTSLMKSTVSSIMADFPFDLKIKVNGFSIKVPGQPTIVVKGTKIDAAAKRALSKARKGDIVTIFGIKQKLVGNSSYFLKQANPLTIEIQ